MQDLIDEPQAFRVSTGFIAFLGALCLPMLLAVAIYAGAWAVSAEVSAAEAASADSTAATSTDGSAVAGWKKGLVGICPVH